MFSSSLKSLLLFSSTSDTQGQSQKFLRFLPRRKSELVSRYQFALVTNRVQVKGESRKWRVMELKAHLKVYDHFEHSISNDK